jgi:hypothetical protein
MIEKDSFQDYGLERLNAVRKWLIDRRSHLVGCSDGVADDTVLLLIEDVETQIAFVESEGGSR